MFQVWNVSFELHYSPRSVVKPGVTCRGMGKMSCDCFRLRQTSWYFVYETTAGLCLDQRRQPGAISSSLCSTTEYCNTTAAVATAMNYLGCNTLWKPLDYQRMQTFHSVYNSPPLLPVPADPRTKSLWHAMFKSTHCTQFRFL